MLTAGMISLQSASLIKSSLTSAFGCAQLVAGWASAVTMSGVLSEHTVLLFEQVLYKMITAYLQVEHVTKTERCRAGERDRENACFCAASHECMQVSEDVVERRVGKEERATRQETCVSHWGLGSRECPMCLLTALWFPCHSTGNSENASSQQIRGTTRERKRGSGGQGP